MDMAKMGRPKKRKSEKRDNYVLVSLNRADYSALKREAKEKGTSMAAILVARWKGE